MKKLLIIIFSILLFSIRLSASGIGEISKGSMIIDYDTIPWDASIDDIKLLVKEYTEFTLNDTRDYYICYIANYEPDSKLTSYKVPKNKTLKTKEMPTFLSFIFKDGELVLLYSGINYPDTKVGTRICFEQFSSYEDIYQDKERDHVEFERIRRIKSFERGHIQIEINFDDKNKTYKLGTFFYSTKYEPDEINEYIYGLSEENSSDSNSSY
jgi:hypothetical protein